jgi:short-subunit dehydrogenase
MSDRSAIVTGASRGIGFGIAQRLATRGFGLTLAARSKDTLALRRRSSSTRAHQVSRSLPAMRPIQVWLAPWLQRTASGSMPWTR